MDFTRKWNDHLRRTAQKWVEEAEGRDHDKSLICPFCGDGIQYGIRLGMFRWHIVLNHFDLSLGMDVEETMAHWRVARAAAREGVNSTDCSASEASPSWDIDTDVANNAAAETVAISPTAALGSFEDPWGRWRSTDLLHDLRLVNGPDLCAPHSQEDPMEDLPAAEKLRMFLADLENETAAEDSPEPTAITSPSRGAAPAVNETLLTPTRNNLALNPLEVRQRTVPSTINELLMEAYLNTVLSVGDSPIYNLILDVFVRIDREARAKRTPLPARSTLLTAPSNPVLKPHEIRERRVPGTIDGHKVEAIPDTGAEHSFISETFLKKLRRRRSKVEGRQQRPPPIEEVSSRASVRLASGKLLDSTRAVKIPWNFEGENSIFWVTCQVVTHLAHDLILGDPFLRTTETLTTLKHRIKTTVRSLGKKLLSSMKFSLNYMGSDKRRIWGYLDDEFVAALPDSGSDIMAMSAEYAKKKGFVVDSSRESQVVVQFADGSTAWTDGVVSGLEWVFADTGEKVVSDFFVLDDLPVDVLFSSDFVFEHDVFGKHESAVFEYGSALDLLQLCNIRLIGRYSRDLERLEEEGLVDATSVDAFSPVMVQRELARRDAIRDAILELPDANQAAARQAEAERQRQWEQWRAEHAQRWANAAPPGPTIPRPEIDGSAQSGGSAGGTTRLLRAGRWARRSLKLVSIPMLPLRRRVPIVDATQV